MTDLPVTKQVLSITPAMLQAWLSDFPDELLQKAERADAWPTVEVVKHLIYGEQTDWIPRLRLMETENAIGRIPTFEPFDRLGHSSIPENSMLLLLEQFKKLRANNLSILDEMEARTDLFTLKGIHPALGAVTGKELLATWAAHDQTHIYQIARNITSRFVHDVGPWSAYLKIINQNSYYPDH